MKEMISGGVLLASSIALKILTTYQLLDGLLVTLNQHNAGFVADVIRSSTLLATMGVVGLSLIAHSWFSRSKSPQSLEASRRTGIKMKGGSLKGSNLTIKGQDTALDTKDTDVSLRRTDIK